MPESPVSDGAEVRWEVQGDCSRDWWRGLERPACWQ